MTASTNVSHWVVALRVGCVLSQVIAARGDLSLKFSFSPEYKFTNSGLLLPGSNKSRPFFRMNDAAEVMAMMIQSINQNLAERLYPKLQGFQNDLCTQ